MVFKLFYKYCRGCFWFIVKGYLIVVEYCMDVVEECRKIEVIVIIFLKIEKCYVRGFYVK